MYHPTLVISFPGNLISSIPTYTIILKSVPGEYFSTLQITISAHRVKFFFLPNCSPEKCSLCILVRDEIVCVSHSVVSDSLQPHGRQPATLLYPWDCPGKNAGADCHFLHQRIFPTQGSNLALLYCRQILYRLSYRGV